MKNILHQEPLFENRILPFFFSNICCLLDTRLFRGRMTPKMSATPCLPIGSLLPRYRSNKLGVCPHRGFDSAPKLIQMNHLPSQLGQKEERKGTKSIYIWPDIFFKKVQLRSWSQLTLEVQICWHKLAPFTINNFCRGSSEPISVSEWVTWQIFVQAILSCEKRSHMSLHPSDYLETAVASAHSHT